LDPNFIMHPLAHPERPDRVRKSENWEARYLDWIRGSVAD
jgi:hypothetical protein